MTPIKPYGFGGSPTLLRERSLPVSRWVWVDLVRIVQVRANDSQEVFMEQEAIYIGIDVSKARVDVAVRSTGDTWEVSHDEAGVYELVSRLKALAPVMVLLEASGGIELSLVAALAAEAVPVVVVNPRQVRDFAKATGKLAKPTQSLMLGEPGGRHLGQHLHLLYSIHPLIRPTPWGTGMDVF